VDEGSEARSSELQQTKQLPQLKVPRRYRRAFDRLGRPQAQPRSFVALATAALLFAGGFFLGRLGSLAPDTPVIRTGTAEGLAPLDVSGSVHYVAGAPGSSRDLTLFRHELESGEVVSLAPLPIPFEGRRPAATRIASMGSSVAVTVADGRGASLVGLFAADRPPLVWFEGLDAAWEAPDRALVLGPEGRVERWLFSGSPRPEPVTGTWKAMFQTSHGAVLVGEEGGTPVLVAFEPASRRTTLELLADARVVAVSPDGTRAALDVGGTLSLWDGIERTDVRTGGFTPEAGSWSGDGDRLAVVLRPPEDGGRVVGVVDEAGNAALKPLPSRSSGTECAAGPAWERSERWVYVAPGDGSIYAVENGGASVERVRTGIVGCGLTWLP
jgi:hypothetical protein